MRLQQYKHIPLKKQKKDNKLGLRCYGPYKVLHGIGSMACKLNFPRYSCLYPIFHVYVLEKVINDKILVQTIQLETKEEWKEILELKIILGIMTN